MFRSIKGQSFVATRDDVCLLFENLREAEKMGFVSERKEKNVHLLGGYCGAGPVSPKWNVKIYNYNQKKGGHSVVCNDSEILHHIFSQNWLKFHIPELPVINFDDSGWGFPLCGVMVGASDNEKVETDVVPEFYFQGDMFSKKSYLTKYAMLGVDLLSHFDASPDTHRVEICTGFVNTRLKERLRIIGFDVRVVEITGLLQDQLEIRFKEYVKRKIGQDIYYDPKDMDKENIPMEYYKCLEFGKKHFPHLLKTGWKSMQEDV